MNATSAESYVINGVLSTIPTPSVGYRAGILNSDGDEKLKRGGSSDAKHGSSGGESDHRVSGVDGEGELVSDGTGDE